MEDDFGRAVSRILSAPKARGRESFVSAADTRNLSRLRGTWSGPLRGPLFGLAPDGVFRASALALGAVGSYPTFSPLPRLRCRSRGGLIFCGTFRRDASRHRLPRLSHRRPSFVGPGRLRGIAPFGVRTFLLPRIASGKAILRPSKITVNITAPRQFDKGVRTASRTPCFGLNSSSRRPPFSRHRDSRRTGFPGKKTWRRG